MTAHQPGDTGASDDPLRVGVRVTIRYRLPAGAGATFTDVIGVVTAVDETAVTVKSRKGPVTVVRRDVVAVRAVPPAPVRRGRPHRAVGAADLQRLMADGWQGVEREGLGDWLLRASSGFTRRANSVLPVGDPSLPAGRAVDYCERWYAERQLAPMFHLDLPASGRPEDDALGAELVSRGYVVDQPTLTMTAAATDVPRLTEASAPVTMDAALTFPWLETYARQRRIMPGVTEQVLTGSPGQLFASTSAGDGSITSIARMSVHPGWAGIHALWVDPAQRRQGLGRTLVEAIALLAGQHRMASLFLQVEDDNEPAIALYGSLGFTSHHTYVYLVPGPRPR